LAYGSQQDGEIWLDVPDVATFHLPAADASLTAIAADSAASDALLDAYYGTALPFIVQAARGLEVLHGSAVQVASRRCVAAFCGSSGAGKSTIGEGLAARGYGHWADDAVAFHVDGPQRVTAVGLPFTVKRRSGSSMHARASSDGLEVVEDFEWKRARLAAVFLLEPHDRIGPGEQAIAVERLGPGEALQALLSNAFRFRPQARERRRETMRSYLELVASVPVLAVRFARDLDRLPDLLDRLERSMLETA